MKVFSFSVFVAGATALGINCRGSILCESSAPFAMLNVQDQLNDMINAGNGSRWFNEHEQIVCSKGQIDSVCVFFQKGASGTAQDALTHVQNLLNHGCSTCGSDPTQDGNDVSTGELTVNAVSDACCVGSCQC
ncbi:hypothetical protein SEPCBS119000_006501 [Sporothrix epigloea]|uniref:Killer toxin Kp4 domain-containing protein n=1 Tax=Sporothrix epigloea TaxID=1892477 RepID=A0ABP0E3C4_9PEZI